MTCSRRDRSTSTSVTPAPCSAMIDDPRPPGSPALPIPELAELQATARNLEPGIQDIPASSSNYPFSALESAPHGHLAKFAANSTIVFRSEIANLCLGNPWEVGRDPCLPRPTTGS
ncbi:hypothetical protein ZWY2020_058210 [Hordeum vulgare]|nr:hypothetical protein ZWY2020_058210 [Hordeum vulgare]